MVEQIKAAEAALAPIVDQACSRTPVRDPERLYTRQYAADANANPYGVKLAEAAAAGRRTGGARLPLVPYITSVIYV